MNRLSDLVLANGLRGTRVLINHNEINKIVMIAVVKATGPRARKTTSTMRNRRRRSLAKAQQKLLNRNKYLYSNALSSKSADNPQTISAMLIPNQRNPSFWTRMMTITIDIHYDSVHFPRARSLKSFPPFSGAKDGIGTFVDIHDIICIYFLTLIRLSRSEESADDFDSDDSDDEEDFAAEGGDDDDKDNEDDNGDESSSEQIDDADLGDARVNAEMKDRRSKRVRHLVKRYQPSVQIRSRAGERESQMKSKSPRKRDRHRRRRFDSSDSVRSELSLSSTLESLLMTSLVRIRRVTTSILRISSTMRLSL